MTTRTEHKDAQFFIGGEVEHSAAFSKKTLFVIGEQPLDKIIAAAKENNVQHIFLTANQSYSDSIDYNTVAIALLDLVYWVTIDYPLTAHARMLSHLSPGVWQSRLFVPMISCKIPGIAIANSNLTIKIDDNFNGVNGGVWCWNQQALLDSNRFTEWKEYADDSVIASVDTNAVQTEVIIDEEFVITEVITDIKKFTHDLGVELGLSDSSVVTDNIGPEVNPGLDSVTNNATQTIDTVSSTEDENVAKTTSVSVDGADVSKEPELVAKKNVKAKK